MNDDVPIYQLYHYDDSGERQQLSWESVYDFTKRHITKREFVQFVGFYANGLVRHKSNQAREVAKIVGSYHEEVSFNAVIKWMDGDCAPKFDPMDALCGWVRATFDDPWDFLTQCSQFLRRPLARQYEIMRGAK